jgi:hypothetical protein
MGGCFSLFAVEHKEEKQEKYDKQIVAAILQDYTSSTFILRDRGQSVMIGIDNFAFSKKDFNLRTAKDFVKKYRMQRCGYAIFKLSCLLNRKLISQSYYDNKLEEIIKKADPDILTFVKPGDQTPQNPDISALALEYNRDYLRYG